MTVIYVGLEVALRKVSPSAAIVAISGSTLITHEYGAEAGLFDSDYFVTTSTTGASLLGALGVGRGGLVLLGAAEAEHVLAGNHASVAQDWFHTLVTHMDHRVVDLEVLLQIGQTVEENASSFTFFPMGWTW